MKRAVITGLGIVSSIGNNQQEVLASLREGRSGITFSQELKDSGCNVVEVTDIKPWQDACATVIADNTSDQAELYQQILDFAK